MIVVMKKFELRSKDTVNIVPHVFNIIEYVTNQLLTFGKPQRIP